MLYSVEEVEDAAFAALTVNLPAAVAAIQARYAAADAAAGRTIDVPLPRPAETPDGDYYLGAAGEILRWPAIEIGLPSIDLQSFDLAQRDADGNGPLVVAVHCSNAQKDLLRRQLLRLTSAVVETVLRSTKEPSVDSVRVAFAWNPETGADDEIQSAGLVIIGLSMTNIAP